MKTRFSRFAVAAVTGVMVTTGGVAFAASSRTGADSPTVSDTAQRSAATTTVDTSAPQSRATSSDLRVTAAPASCAHVAADDLSSIVTFHKRSGTGPATYTVQALDPSTHAPVHTRALRVGAGAPSTINIVWHQQKQSRGDVSLRVLDENGHKVARVDEAPGAKPLAARCGTAD